MAWPYTCLSVPTGREIEADDVARVKKRNARHQQTMFECHVLKEISESLGAPLGGQSTNRLLLNFHGCSSEGVRRPVVFEEIC